MTEDHLSFDELAELAEGLLTEDRTRAARAHVAECAQCQERAAAISGASVALAGLPPVTMPDDVVARLDAVLAAERPAADVPEPAPAMPEPSTPEPSTPEPSDTSPDEPEPAPAMPVGDGRSMTVIPDVADITKHRRWGRPSAATSAVAAVVVLAAGAIAVAHFAGGNDSSSSGSTSAAASGSAASSASGPIGPNTSTSFPQVATGRVYNAANISTLVPQLIGTTPQRSAKTAGASTGSDGKASHEAATTPAASSTAPLPQSNSVAASAAASSAPSAPAAQPGQFESAVTSNHLPDALRPLASSHTELLACAATLATTPHAVPEAVDFARWTGGQYHRVPSIVVVFNGPKPHTLAVFVESPNCKELRTYTLVTLPS